MKITLYFGSFNPIHNGHTQLASYVIGQNIADEVWFVVSPRNPFKQQNSLIDEYLRLDMVILAISNLKGLKASDVEFSMPTPSYTIDTLHKLSSSFPEHDFSIMIGSDNVFGFDKWKEYREILNNFEVFVYPRTDFDFELYADKYPEMTLLNSSIVNVSSTQIRNAIVANEPISQWVNPAVEKFIVENNLFV